MIDQTDRLAEIRELLDSSPYMGFASASGVLGAAHDLLKMVDEPLVDSGAKLDQPDMPDEQPEPDEPNKPITLFDKIQIGDKVEIRGMKPQRRTVVDKRGPKYLKVEYESRGKLATIWLLVCRVTRHTPQDAPGHSTA